MKCFAVLCLLAVAVSARPQNVVDEFFDPNPQYKFEYKVASDETQTYMTQEETRDGDYVNGEYSYVDPNGALVTVVYQAGPEGYSETRSLQEAFISINQPVAGSSTSTVTRPISRNRVNVNDDDRLVNKIVRELTPYIEETVSTSFNSK